MLRLVEGAEGHILFLAAAWCGRQKQTFPSLPSLPLPLQDSEKQLEGTGWWERQEDPHVDPGKRRGWGINMARGGISVRCRQGLTLPLGLLHVVG